ncbi:hypothetical protein AC579_2723 [Pseudocercospora musae]|uniref:Carboxymuconolactone decarboxylase-like domain-containing protein n=1 Tax=Pseudocercospora musae TaxID=113226 RepID=A0A139IVL9_9PEZI|nr:hypothetical protein AC579_2723 [Pseudocercospora musae]
MSEQDPKTTLTSLGEEWSPAWQSVLDHCPAYLAAYIKLRSVPINEQVLSRKMQELVLLAIDASCTHLYRPGIEVHVRAAIACGASPEEVVETLELSSAVGIHALAVGTPILAEALEERGQKLPRTLSPQQEKIKATFVREKKWWNERLEQVLHLAPKFFDAYTKYTILPFEEGHSQLSLKEKELIYCAIDSAPTHLFEPGLKIHVRKVLDCGGSAEEIIEVFQLATLMGAQTVVAGAEALERVLRP